MKDQDMFVYASWMEKFGGFAKDMTLRDYFAAKAMQGLLAANWCADLRNDHYGENAGNSTVAIDAYMMADAMLKARGQ